MASFEHLDFGIFCHSSLHTLSCSVQLDGDRRWPIILGFSRDVRLSSSQGTVVPKPLLCCLGWVLTFIVLLEGEPSVQSEVLSILDQVFIKDISLLSLISFPLTLTSHPVPATEKHPQSMMLPPPCITVGMVLGRWWVVPGFLWTWLQIEAKLFNLGLMRPENLVSHSLSVPLRISGAQPEWPLLPRPFSPEFSVWLGGQL